MVAKTSEAIRDAATVLILREALEGRPELYFLRRPANMRAFAGVWAFPGGSVDPEDRQVEWRILMAPLDISRATDLARSSEAWDEAVNMDRFLAWAREEMLKRRGYVPHDGIPAPDHDPRANLAVWITAIRELFEESGLLLAHGIDSGFGSEQPAYAQWRAALRTGSRTFLEMCRDRGLRPNLDTLSYLGRLVTPSFEPVRFNTRFFLAWLPRGQNPEGRTGAHEEVWEECWMSPQEALSRYQSGVFPMANPTRFLLEQLEKFSTARDLWASCRGWPGAHWRRDTG